MEKITAEEEMIISVNEPIKNIDTNLIKTIEIKMLKNKDYAKLNDFYNTLYDFSDYNLSYIADMLIERDEKKCISIFLDNNSLYFMEKENIDKLKNFLNIYEINVKLFEHYDYYYKLLFSHGVRLWKTINRENIIKEYIFTRYNKLFNIKLKQINSKLLVASFVNYLNYNNLKEQQQIEAIEYLNLFGFNVEINNIISL